MTVKNIDSLLDELNKVQLSKDSMKGITGGWTASHETQIGILTIRYRDSDCRIMDIRINGRFVFAFEIEGGADSHS